MKEQIITINPIEVKHATVYVEGDSELILNKMNARNRRDIIAQQTGKKTTKEVPNFWEDAITAIHWDIPIPVKDTYKECTEETMKYMLENGKPQISTFGFRASLGDAVVRNKIDQYGTKIKNAVNAVNPYEPVTYVNHYIAEEVISLPGKKSSKMVVYLNHFTGWRSQFNISYTENVFSLEQIINIVNMAGFGIGIGSGRPNGYGRYHVVDVK